MQNSIKEIGKALLNNGNDFISYLALSLQDVVKGKKQYLIKINLNNKSKKIEISTEEISSQTSNKYLWIGNADGPASPQWYFTTTNPEYLLSQTLPNLLDKLDEKSELYHNLLRTKENFYYDLGIQKKSKSRYQFVMDLQLLDENLEEIKRIKEKNKGEVKKIIKEINKNFLDYIKKNKELSKNEIGLYHITIDGESITDSKEYRKLVIKEKLDSLFDKTSTDICHVCGKENVITDNTSRMEFKYYITDKKGFSSNLKGDFYKSMGICKDCYRNLLAGEIYTKTNLKDKIGALTFYILPSFLFPKELNKTELDRWISNIKDSVGPALRLQNLYRIEKKVNKNLKRDKDNSYILNFLFYEKKPASQEFKVLKLIKDVPPSRIKEMLKVSEEVKIFGKEILGESKLWEIDLNKIYYLIPVKSGKNGVVEYRDLLSLYDSIFTKKPISYNQLINKFVELIGVYKFEKFDGYNVNKPEGIDGLKYILVQINLMMKYLRNLDVLEGVRGMETGILSFDERIKKFIEEMSYDEGQCALFLLGYLIGEVGNAQRNADLSSEPILNKLNYQGMTTLKIDRLILEMTEKLKQYKTIIKNKETGEVKKVHLLYLNNNIYGTCNKLWLKHRNNWKLSNQENVLYILSGYSFNNMMRINYKNIK